jgi:predicted ester cyclase
MEKMQNTAIIRQLYLDYAAGMQYADERVSEYITISSRPSSLKAFDTFFSTVRDALANYTLTLNNIAAEGDRVLVQYTISGIHQADFMGIPPTHERTTITGIDVFRLDNGKVVEHWDSAHQIASMTQQYPRRHKPVRKLSRSGVY